MTVSNVRIDEFVDRGNQILDTVAATARICAQFLPKFELPPNAKSVLSTTIESVTLDLDDVTTIPLTEIRIRFAVDWQQLSAADLTAPLYLVQKHAQNYCRLEDRLLLMGQGGRPNQLPLAPAATAVPNVTGGEIERGQTNDGLSGARRLFVGSREITEGIGAGHSLLEGDAIAGPWAIVMGSDLYDRANRTEANFIDTARQRIESLLRTKIYRTTILDNWTALLVGGARSPEDLSVVGELTGPVDRAVSLEPQLRFIRTDDNGRCHFMIVGSLALRVKDDQGIVQVGFSPR